MEVGTGEGAGGAGVLVVQAVAIGQAAASLHPQELLVTLVELVVTNRRRLKAKLVHRLDGGLVVERGGQERRGADDVASCDRDGVGVSDPRVPQVGGEVLDATGVFGHVNCGRARCIECVIGDDSATGPTWGLEVAVEVVEREDLDLDRGAVGRSLGGRSGHHHPGCACQHSGENSGNATSA